MTRYMKWIGLAAAALMLLACFLPWVSIAYRNITVSGADASGTSFGKPGYFHLILLVFFLAFNFIPRVWAKRANLLVVGLNFGWALRNWFLLTACQAGDCPHAEPGLWLMALASVLMLLAALFPDMKLPEEKTD